MAEKTTVYAGRGEIARTAAAFSLLGVLVAGGLVAISAWATHADIAQNWEWLEGWPERLNHWATWIGIGTGVYLAIVLFCWRYPWVAREFWVPRAEVRHTRKTALRLARRWPAVVRATFKPIKHRGTDYLPGLRALIRWGEAEFGLHVLLPENMGKVDREEWLNAAAKSLKFELGVEEVSVLTVQERGASFAVIVRDLTEEAREVQL